MADWQKLSNRVERNVDRERGKREVRVREEPQRIANVASVARKGTDTIGTGDPASLSTAILRAEIASVRDRLDRSCRYFSGGTAFYEPGHEALIRERDTAAFYEAEQLQIALIARIDLLVAEDERRTAAIVPVVF